MTCRRVVRSSTNVSEKRTKSSECSQPAACHTLWTVKWRQYFLSKPRKTNITHVVTTQATTLFSYHCENLKSDKYVQDLLQYMMTYMLVLFTIKTIQGVNEVYLLSAMPFFLLPPMSIHLHVAFPRVWNHNFVLILPCMLFVDLNVK